MANVLTGSQIDTYRLVMMYRLLTLFESTGIKTKGHANMMRAIRELTGVKTGSTTKLVYAYQDYLIKLDINI